MPTKVVLAKSICTEMDHHCTEVDMYRSGPALCTEMDTYRYVPTPVVRARSVHVHFGTDHFGT